MSDPTLPPEVEAALRDLCGCSANDAMTLQDVECHHIEVREAYRLGLAAGREDGELLDWLNRGFYAIDRCGPGGPWTVRSYWGMGDWVESGTANTLRAAIRAAKGADRG